MNVRQRCYFKRRRDLRLYWLTIAVVLITWFLAAFASAQCIGGVCQPPSNWQSAPAVGQGKEVQVGPAIASAVCRVVNESHKETSVGSGALVRVSSGFAYVLTCDHLFRDGVGGVSIRYATGLQQPARIITRDSRNDLALLRTSEVNLPTLNYDPSKPLGMVTAIGLGGNGRLRAVRGSTVGASRAVGAEYPSLLLQGAVRSGDSGGPLINDRGRLIGVVWGVRGGVTYATAGRPVAAVLSKIPNQPTRPVAGDAQTAPSGSCDCQGNCLSKEDAEDFARRKDLAQLVSRADFDAATSLACEQHQELSTRLNEINNRESPISATATSAMKNALPVLFTALGVGGPVGLAWLALKLWWRRHGAKRRGSGGPRQRRFRSEPTAGHINAKVSMERTAGSTDPGGHASTASSRGA